MKKQLIAIALLATLFILVVCLSPGRAATYSAYEYMSDVGAIYTGWGSNTKGDVLILMSEGITVYFFKGSRDADFRFAFKGKHWSVKPADWQRIDVMEVP